ncbi:hypothetical protein A0128_16740 [Leptospira tipperaryensis]|uniref:Uncharacterized protein n=1 Tax=Leptospira tipperaryensis TaxID=2564040 RepID=A0A1D7V0I4_9LEPT|nr:hypothetical protein A0128_16740 [Leptospira tipperaryensis]
MSPFRSKISDFHSHEKPECSFNGDFESGIPRIKFLKENNSILINELAFARNIKNRKVSRNRKKILRLLKSNFFHNSSFPFENSKFIIYSRCYKVGISICRLDTKIIYEVV